MRPVPLTFSLATPLLNCPDSEKEPGKFDCGSCFSFSDSLIQRTTRHYVTNNSDRNKDRLARSHSGFIAKR